MALPTYEDITSPSVMEETRQRRVHYHKQTVNGVVRAEARWEEGVDELIVAFQIDGNGTTKFDHLIIPTE